VKDVLTEACDHNLRGFLFPVTWQRLAVIRQFTACPENPARYEIQVTRVFYGFIVVADRGAENARLTLVEISPGNHNIALTLLAASQRLSAIEHLDVIVQLLVNSGPIRQPFGNGTVMVGEANGDRELRAVPAGLQAQVFKPIAMWRPE